MTPHVYRFRKIWTLDVSPDRVFDAIVDLDGYPTWWPDVRSAIKVDEHTAELVCRSRLPYALVVRMRRVEENRAEGRMSVALSGDLEGRLSGVVRTRRAGAEVEITQQVVVRKRSLRVLGPLARPAFRLNHTLMMNRGERGLRAHLANEQS